MNNDPFYAKSIEEIVNGFNSDIENGLSSAQLGEKESKYGLNKLPEVKKSLWRIYLAPLFNFLILILLVSGVVIVILGSPESTIITFTVVFINSVTAIVQQFRAQKALESLKKIAALQAVVVRNGEQKEIPTERIFPGDIIIIEQGSKIPADGRIIDSMNLSINEAPLTGESEAVEKNERIINETDLHIQNQVNMVFMGTYVNTGRAKIIITATGIDTQIGKISDQLNRMGSLEEIPLTKKLNRLGYILGIIVIINLVILIIYKLSFLNMSGQLTQPLISEALTDSILRALNILPINLPLLVTLVLITGVLNMARKGVIIKNLSAIESLGRVSVICSDKTGTITKNEMTVEKFLINEKEYTVSGSGYDPEGNILYNGDLIKLNENRTFEKFIDSMVVNNNAKLIFEDVKIHKQGVKAKAVRREIGSPTEAALLVLAEKAGYIIYDIKRKYEIVMEFSFNSKLKRMTTICKYHNNDNLFKNSQPAFIAFIKGAPEVILERSSTIDRDGSSNKFSEEMKNTIIKLVNERAKQGFRTLAIAYKNLDKVEEPERDEIEKEITFLGFVSIMDPPRNGVKNAVKESKLAGIRVIMITGDHALTAKTIASEMSIYQEGDLILEGKNIRDVNEKDLDQVSVFARVEPSDKEIIVNHYQNKNKVVAMTGDGINDTPALRAADCGIAMGITGTDLAKETADMVISNDNFTSIEQGVKIGRGLFAKIRTIIFFFICLNIMEGIIFFAYEFVPGFELFSSNWQHIYIFAIAHSFPSLALVIDFPPKDIMQEPPRNEEEILNKNMWFMLLIQAFFLGIGLVIILQLTLGQIIPLNDWNLNPIISYIPNLEYEKLVAQKARTMFITTLFIEETMFIWSFRRPNKSLMKSLKEEFSWTLFFVCGFTLLLHVLYISFSYIVNFYVNEIFQMNLNINFMFLSFTDWLLCILFALPGIFGLEIYKFYTRKNDIYF